MPTINSDDATTLLICAKLGTFAPVTRHPPLPPPPRSLDRLSDKAFRPLRQRPSSPRPPLPLSHTPQQHCAGANHR